MFADVAADTLAKIAAASHQRHYLPGAVVFAEGEQPDVLHVLLSGSVQLSASAPDGREAVVELLRPVDAFLLAAVLTAQPYLMSAKTLEDTLLLLIPCDVLLGELAVDRMFTLTVLGSMAGQYRRLVRQIKDLRLRTVSQRLALYLLQLVENEGVGLKARLPYDKRTVAARLDMKPESLSRAIAGLRQYGVNVSGNLVEVTDLVRLREFCRLDQVLDKLDADLQVMVPHEEA